MKIIMVLRQKEIKLFNNAFGPVTAKLAMQKAIRWQKGQA